MRLLLDTSVLLAASGSPSGASRELFRLAPANGWELLATPYIIEEVVRNLAALPPAATSAWAKLDRAGLDVRKKVKRQPGAKPSEAEPRAQ